MHRIDSVGAAAGNLFTEGNPATATPATVVSPAWLNAVQEEIAGVVEGAGIALDKPDNGQLLEAIQALIAAQLAPTGTVRLTLATVTPAGWVMMNDGSIGNAGSAATTRANADTEALFALIWTNIADTWAPVSGGRGGSAAIDFAANKTITLPKALGRALAAAGAGAGLTARGLGETLGTETHPLTLAQMPVHDHSLDLPRRGGTTFAAGEGWCGDDVGSGTAIKTTTQAGAGAAHPNMQPSLFLNVMVKL